MIPKIIHYCWFGGKEMPPLVQKCIKSWKEHLPDYEFKLWNEETFDINSSEWCKGAYENKKYAFEDNLRIRKKCQKQFFRHNRRSEQNYRQLIIKKLIYAPILFSVGAFSLQKIICQDEIPVLSIGTFGICIVSLENFS